MKVIWFIFLLLCGMAGYASADNLPAKVDVVQGERLVQVALFSTRYRNLNFDESPDNNTDTFLVYSILGATEGTLTHFAVNRWTGDVWDMDECKMLINPSLQKAQAAVRKQFSGDELKEYPRLHALKPYRMYDLEPCL